MAPPQMTLPQIELDENEAPVVIPQIQFMIEIPIGRIEEFIPQINEIIAQLRDMMRERGIL